MARMEEELERSFINTFSWRSTGSTGWQNVWAELLFKKNVPPNGQTRQAKSSSQLANLMITPRWRLILRSIFFILRITSNHLSLFPPGYNPGWVGAVAVQGPADWSGNSQGGSTRHCSTNSRHCATRGTLVHLACRTQANGTLWSPWQRQDYDAIQCLESSAWYGGGWFELEYQGK